ncbi:DUF1232 domain-containing protein [Sporosarcina sp. ACRSL]|uniref:YkvA family protein n=1 Tax=Sporosarcina sp. ACRSL TaxID=2918215 RepID=UPI001EF52E4A|nr:YkvA family protein [Sporosarcina sp. ACRSL]MCG7344027.1 DUF1232 domain-containing protein [Sporosarcina sp. ACRSL]
MTNNDEHEQYAEHYSEKKFWNKVLKYAKKAGVKVTYAALLLFYTLQKPTTPIKAKSIIIGALGYFILPLDLIPDVAPVVGYVDDLGVIIGALVVVAAHIDNESKQKAKGKIVEWFGEGALEETASVDKDIDKNQEKNE